MCNCCTRCKLVTSGGALALPEERDAVQAANLRGNPGLLASPELLNLEAAATVGPST
jgi:hypothetical protein